MTMTEPASRKPGNPPDPPADSPPPTPDEEMDLVKRARRGDLTAYENFPIAFDASDVGRRFRVRLVFSMQLKQRGAEKALLKEEIAGEAYYTTGNDVVGTEWLLYSCTALRLPFSPI